MMALYVLVVPSFGIVGCVPWRFIGHPLPLMPDSTQSWTRSGKNLGRGKWCNDWHFMFSAGIWWGSLGSHMLVYVMLHQSFPRWTIAPQGHMNSMWYKRTCLSCLSSRRLRKPQPTTLQRQVVARCSLPRSRVVSVWKVTSRVSFSSLL